MKILLDDPSPFFGVEGTKGLFSKYNIVYILVLENNNDLNI